MMRSKFWSKAFLIQSSNLSPKQQAMNTLCCVLSEMSDLQCFSTVKLTADVDLHAISHKVLQILHSFQMDTCQQGTCIAFGTYYFIDFVEFNLFEKCEAPYYYGLRATHLAINQAV